MLASYSPCQADDAEDKAVAFLEKPNSVVTRGENLPGQSGSAHSFAILRKCELRDHMKHSICQDSNLSLPQLLSHPMQKPGKLTDHSNSEDKQ
jgi:hypothetical protein